MKVEAASALANHDLRVSLTPWAMSRSCLLLCSSNANLSSRLACHVVAQPPVTHFWVKSRGQKITSQRTFAKNQEMFGSVYSYFHRRGGFVFTTINLRAPLGYLNALRKIWKIGFNGLAIVTFLPLVLFLGSSTPGGAPLMIYLSFPVNTLPAGC